MTTLELSHVTFPGSNRQYHARFKAGQVAVIYGETPSVRYRALQVVSGQLLPEHGLVTLNGQILNEMPVDKRVEITRSQYGFMYGNDLLLDYLTAVENCLIPEQNITGITIERTKILLRSLGINKPELLFPDQLSSLHRKLVSLARCLRLRPSILLAFEPSAGLSDEETASLYSTFRTTAMDRELIILATEAAVDPGLTHLNLITLGIEGDNEQSGKEELK